MAKNRFLTKSRFKTAHECPAKLHYLDNDKFASDKLDDKFLKALADGGFQVGELAKIYYPGGTEIIERDHHKAAEQTRELLKQDSVIIYEASLLHDNLFVKVDILVKKGKSIRLLEVKAKSWRNGDSFTTKKGSLSSEWEEYVADISFQRHVAMKAFPDFKYSCFLFLADKDKTATVDGIHQKFLLSQKDGRTSVEVVPGTTKEILGEPLLCEVSADNAIELFVNQEFDGKNFEQYVAVLSKLAQDRTLAPPSLSRSCGSCEYRVQSENLNGKSSGFVNCWTKATKHKAEEFDQPMIFDVWNLHYTKKDVLIADSRYFMKEITIEDIGPEEDDSTELSAKQRQWMQIDFFQKSKKGPHFDVDHFSERSKVERWRAPFHFIDFETLTSAIPFHKGLRPYETIAFQFSHHVIDRAGNLRHEAQYINVKPGAFPNFEFLRALKDTLSKDDGTVFRYAAHENTVLNHIRTQLLSSNEKDKDELIAFIETLTVRKENSKIVHEGQRKMVDMLELVKKLYYSPQMGGSNSIKKVLPAVLQESEMLKAKYSKPIYGASGEINSHNFKNKSWIKIVNGIVEDPYKSLDPIFKDVDPESLGRMERLFADDEIKEGGAASTAYARMQFTRMSEEERNEIAQALLRYCELDTMAMVMIWEYWTGELVKKAKKAA
jgi:hypothetical protein